MKIRQTPNEILIRHIPVVRWTGGLMASLIIFVLIVWLFTSGTSGSSFLIDLFFYCVGIIATLAIIYLSVFDFWSNSGIRAPMMSMVLSKPGKFIDISYTRLYGKRVKRFYFYQVEKFRSYKIKRLGYPRYFLALKLPNRKSIRMDIPLGSDKNTCV